MKSTPTSLYTTVESDTLQSSWKLNAIVRLHENIPDLTDLIIRETHRCDHLVADAWVSGRHKFIKIFAPTKVRQYDNEVNAYRTLFKEPFIASSPVMVHDCMAILTDYVDGTRLGELPSNALMLHLKEVPDIYSSMLFSTGATAEVPSSYLKAWKFLEQKQLTTGLPSPEVVVLHARQFSMAVSHGDLQPMNIIANHTHVTIVDFESYGPTLMALDIARLAFNPLLDLSSNERIMLSNEMLAAAHRATGTVISHEELVSCVIIWSVCCAAHFQNVIEKQPNYQRHTPEAIVLSLAPLQIALNLWNRSIS